MMMNNRHLQLNNIIIIIGPDWNCRQITLLISLSPISHEQDWERCPIQGIVFLFVKLREDLYEK